MLIYGGREATYAIDAETLRVVRRYPVGAYTTGISADGRMLAIGGRDGSVRLLNLGSGRVWTLTKRHHAKVLSEAFSPDGRTLATADEEGRVIVSDVREGGRSRHVEGQRGERLEPGLQPRWAAPSTRPASTRA